MAIQIKSFNQILGDMVRKIVADTPTNDLNPGSILLTLLEAAAANDFENNTSILNVLELLNIDSLKNSDLDSKASEFGLTRRAAIRASGLVDILKTNITKICTGLYVVKPAPVAGQTVLYVNNVDSWGVSDTGTLYIGRGTESFEGPISYYHSASVRGAYQGFFDSNIQPDFVHIDHIQEYPLVYLPYPAMLKQETARKLTEYVARGGKVICEGCPGYFGDRGHVGEVQPNLGLDTLFGAREKYVEFVPDLLENLTLTVRGSKIPGRFFLQEYELTNGRAAGHYHNGSVAAVENSYGKGKTLLIGTFPGAGYYSHPSPDGQAFFASLLDWAHVIPKLRCSDNAVKVRLHEGAGGTYIWVLNPTRTPRRVDITFTSSDFVAVERTVCAPQQSHSGVKHGHHRHSS